jgi:large subunit ribosomal protein L32
MAHPTRKHSKARRDDSRMHWRLKITSTTQCAQCGAKILPHRACPSCGFYRGRQIVPVKAKRSETT